MEKTSLVGTMRRRLPLAPISIAGERIRGSRPEEILRAHRGDAIARPAPSLGPSIQGRASPRQGPDNFAEIIRGNGNHRGLAAVVSLGNFMPIVPNRGWIAEVPGLAAGTAA